MGIGAMKPPPGTHGHSIQQRRTVNISAGTIQEEYAYCDAAEDAEGHTSPLVATPMVRRGNPIVNPPPER